MEFQASVAYALASRLSAGCLKEESTAPGLYRRPVRKSNKAISMTKPIRLLG